MTPINYYMMYVQFADDVTVWCASRNLETIERKLQKATKIMHDFANKWGMKINANKTNYTILQKYKIAFKISPTLSLKIDNTTILKIDNPILLGITLDKHLSFDKHFQDMHKSLTKKLHLIRLLSSKNYNINPEYLITINKAFILSKIQ
ncbi:reverse transcriptase (RNA-dependent DNA polymerase) [Brachionus plicatilis]|uniref:Reverse transcriptase (RNA-dependent DNA polymerase) n=1 Tax=Brachionus plicatilis TaxID=10195 RepID=A0A3M7SK06_BRAPC|nr:reverse transcriptase (RNA-dependent DNA polymerase) [Brachionus plicatilis]